MWSIYTLALLCFACTYSLSAASAIARDINDGHWVTSWTAVPQAVNVDRLPPAFNQMDLAFSNATIRQTLRMTLGAEQIRIRLSNAFGQSALPITKVTAALPNAEIGQNVTGSSRVHIESLRTLNFGGSDSVIIPEGALVVSDPFYYPTEAGQVLSLSMYLHEGLAGTYMTSHPVSRSESWLALGDYASSANMPPLHIGSRPSWYFVSAVEIWRKSSSRAFAIVGDSITDGSHSSLNTNSQWPSLLFNRMQESPYHGLKDISVVNQGAAGNRELSNGNGGSNAVSRIDRDILAQSGLGYVMVFEGLNDIGYAGANRVAQTEVGDRLIQYYKQMISRVHAFSVPVFGSTITPFACYNASITVFANPLREQTRLRLNEWIRNSGWFDAVIDFDKILRDPSNHTELMPSFDSGDCIHPNDAGYREMAAEFPLEVFEKFRDGVSSFGFMDHDVDGFPLVNGPGSDVDLADDDYPSILSSYGKAKTVPMPLTQIGTFLFGFVSCAAIGVVLRSAWRFRCLSWWRLVISGYQSLNRYKQKPLGEAEGSVSELMNLREFEEEIDG